MRNPTIRSGARPRAPKHLGPISAVLKKPSFRDAAWLLPAAFALHVVEEAPGFTTWVDRYASNLYTQSDFVRNNALGLLLTVVATLIVRRWRNRPIVFIYYSAILTQQALFNTVFHVGATVAYGAYSPGVVTAVLLFLPVWHYLTRLVLREGLLTTRSAVVGAVIGGVIHTVVVAQQVFFVPLP